MFSIYMIAISDGSSAGLPRPVGKAGSDTDRRLPSRGRDQMTLEQLPVFVAVAERQHVTEAAHALHLAQSAVSHAIAALEARHDTKLFNRVGRRIELTEAGQVFLAEARAVLPAADVGVDRSVRRRAVRAPPDN